MKTTTQRVRMLPVVLLLLPGGGCSGVLVDPAKNPVLDAILPAGAGYGATITLLGRDFGDESLTGRAVVFGTVAATTYPSWRDGEIRVVVPTFDPPSAEQAEVKVVLGSRESGALAFDRQEANILRLTVNSATDWQPCWADTSTISFASSMGGGFNIWHMADDGGNLTQRTFFTAGTADMPAYEGVTLYYRSSHRGDYDIY